MKIEEIQKRFERSLRKFLDEEDYLLVNDVSERAMTHKLAEYLKEEFPGKDVDCEYNRNGERPKELQFTLNQALRSEAEKLVRRAAEFAEELKRGENEYREIDDLRLKPFSTYPDIIVHTRGENHPHNILIVEVKKHDGENADFDFAKLSAFTAVSEENRYGYHLGIHLTLHCKGPRASAPDIRYFIGGHVDDRIASAVDES